MDTRFFGFLAISFIMVLMYQAWMEDYAPKTSQRSALEASSNLPGNAKEQAPGDLPPTDFPEVSEQQTQTDTPNLAVQEQILKLSTQGQTIEVLTDVLKLKIDLQGGNIVVADLLGYPENSSDPEKKVRLYNQDPEQFFSAQSGLQSANGPAPDHYANYTAEQMKYSLDGLQQLDIPLLWKQDNITVIKTITVNKGSYLIQVSHKLINSSDQVWTGRQYRQLQRASSDDNGNALIQTYTGGVIYSREEKYEKISYDDMEDGSLKRKFDHGWAAMIQHYFLSAWIPQAEEENQYYTSVNKTMAGQRYILGINSPMQQVPAAAETVFSTQLFVGPKIHKVLEETAEGLELTVDFGWLTPISEPLFWLLSYIHDYVGNWGWAIILLTLLIKLVFYKLSEASYKSMAKMRKFTPKLQTIRERYADDRQRQSQAMMELYKKEKLNPMGGCFPVLIQIPVFIALYWVLLESVELRQAPFILWLDDLSSKDPFYVLPVIMGITMYIQQKINPPPIDPIQAKVFAILPFVFTVFFAFFPSGLVLYWVVNNTLTIAQQWYITNKVMGKSA